MAREGVTYEQVKAAAEELVGEGREPSIRAVRERLRGTGHATVPANRQTWTPTDLWLPSPIGLP